MGSFVCVVGVDGAVRYILNRGLHHSPLDVAVYGPYFLVIDRSATVDVYLLADGSLVRRWTGPNIADLMPRRLCVSQQGEVCLVVASTDWVYDLYGTLLCTFATQVSPHRVVTFGRELWIVTPSLDVSVFRLYDGARLGCGDLLRTRVGYTSESTLRQPNYLVVENICDKVTTQICVFEGEW